MSFSAATAACAAASRDPKDGLPAIGADTPQAGASVSVQAAFNILFDFVQALH